jgi:hypothetical protein
MLMDSDPIQSHWTGEWPPVNGQDGIRRSKGHQGDSCPIKKNIYFIILLLKINTKQNNNKNLFSSYGTPKRLRRRQARVGSRRSNFQRWLSSSLIFQCLASSKTSCFAMTCWCSCWRTFLLGLGFVDLDLILFSVLIFHDLLVL